MRTDVILGSNFEDVVPVTAIESEKLIQPIFLQALRPLDYQSLLQLASQAKSRLESYLSIRAALVLGDNDQAETLATIFSQKFPEETSLQEFITLACELYRKKDVAASLAKLSQMDPKVFLGPLIGAEYYFILGYACNLNDEYRQGTRHHKKAAELYSEMEMPCAASVAWFNLCICYNHLNERILFDLAFERLRDLALRSPTPTTRLHHERMAIYRLVDREEDERAIALLVPLLDVAYFTGRLRDKGSLACLLGYLYLRNGYFEEFWNFEKAVLQCPIAPEHRVVLNELSSLSHVDLLSRDSLKRSITRWRKQQILSVHQLYLYDIVLQRLWRGRDHEYLLKIAESAGQLSLTHQQALGLVDFRYHEILGLLRTGQKDKARVLLHSYAEDARHDGAEPRLTKSASLEAMLAKSNDLTEWTAAVYT